MNSQEVFFDRLRQLLEGGSLSRSVCSGQFLAQIGPLLHGGVLAEERSGAGRRIVVIDRAALSQFLQNRFPNLPIDPAASARAMAVARFRDSKVLPNDTAEIISVRTWSERAISFAGKDPEAKGMSVNPGRQALAATSSYGVFSFLLGGECELQFNGSWALVENPALFVHFERLGLPIPAVLYSRGKISTRLLDWLATRSAPDFSLTHFPDYDPAGLMDFQRIRARFGARSTLHLPADIEIRFSRLSNPALLRKSGTRSMLAALRDCSCKDIRRVVAMIDRHNAGLEQEALLVNLLVAADVNPL